MKRRTKIPNRGERGQVFVVVLVLMLVGALFITPLLNFIGTGIKSGMQNEKRMNELYAADSGVEYAAWLIKSDNGSLPGEGNTVDITPLPSSINQKSLERVSVYCLTKNDNGGTYKVTSVASTPGVSRTVVEAWVESIPALWDNAITTTGVVNISPGASVNGDV